MLSIVRAATICERYNASIVDFLPDLEQANYYHGKLRPDGTRNDAETLFAGYVQETVRVWQCESREAAEHARYAD